MIDLIDSSAVDLIDLIDVTDVFELDTTERQNGDPFGLNKRSKNL